jgi:hypothetical protein
MRNRTKFLLVFITTIIGLILLMNYRYPFLTSNSEGWSVGYNSLQSIKSTLNISSENIITSKGLNRFNKNDESVFLADPFFIVKNDTTFLFVENQIKNDNARIDVFVSVKNKKYEYKGIALDAPFHLSYPQVFTHEKKYYMIPETKRSNQVLLYSTSNFPYDWIVKDTLIKNVRYKDPTLLILKNDFFLFTVDDNLNLYIYRSKTLGGPWKKFDNHTKIKGNEARPGGRVFKVGENYFLPMQNLQNGYGSGVSLYSISFEKERLKLQRVFPWFLSNKEHVKWFNKGMHHVDIQKQGNGFYAVYDGDKKGNKKVFNWKRTIKYNLIDLNLY